MTVESLTPVDPWALYAILLAFGRKSCDYNLEDEIRVAARGTLGRPVARPWYGAHLITAVDYDRLLVYHSECRDMFLGKEKEIWEKAGTQWPWFDAHCTERWFRVGDYELAIPMWFPEFCSEVKEAFCKEFREEVIEDVNLWFGLLDKHRSADKLCYSCLRTSVLKMPVYTKVLSKLSLEAISQTKLTIEY